MTLPRAGRRPLLAVHLSCSIGWIGAVCAYLVLAFAVPATDDPETVRAAWIAMDLVGSYAIVPLALGTLVTGVLLGLATPWGLFRHYWVLVSLIGTTLLTLVLVLHMPGVGAQSAAARKATSAQLAGMGSDIPHALAGLLLLAGILVLNLYKPRGLTRYGWRRQEAERRRIRSASV